MSLSKLQTGILRVIFDIQGPSGATGVRDSQIAGKLNIDLQEIQDHLELLEESRYVQLAKAFGPTYTAWLTSRGRMLLRDMKTTHAKLGAKSIGAVRKLLYSQTRGDIKQILLEAGASPERILPIQVTNDMRSPDYLSKEAIISKMFDPIYSDYEKDKADRVLIELVRLMKNRGVEVSDALKNLSEDGVFLGTHVHTDSVTAEPATGRKENSDSFSAKQEEIVARDRAFKYDVFICHAREDKKDIAEPLAISLESRGKRVWLDKFILRIRDSLLKKIDEGLTNSRYGIVILGPSFFGKDWPQKELDGLTQKEIGGKKVIGVSP